MSGNEASEKEEDTDEEREGGSVMSGNEASEKEEDTDEEKEEKGHKEVGEDGDDDYEDDNPPVASVDHHEDTLLPPAIWDWMMANDLDSDLERKLGEQLGKLRKVTDRSLLENEIKLKIVDAFRAAYKTAEEANAKKSQWVQAFEVLCNRSDWILTLRAADKIKFVYRNITKYMAENEKAEAEGTITEAEKVIWAKRISFHRAYKTIEKRKKRLFEYCVKKSFSVDREIEEAGQEDNDPCTKRMDRLIASLIKIARSKQYTKALREYLIREIDKLIAIQPADGPKQTKIPKRNNRPGGGVKTLPSSKTRKLA
jgi:hypothetical protein